MAQHEIYDTACEVNSVADNLWSVKNCFGTETFDHFGKLHLNHDETWHRHQDCLEYRLQLTPESPTMLKMQELSQAMMPAIENIVGYELIPSECKVWLDLSAWHCPYHADAPLLFVTYQVYFWSHGDVYGTEFCHGDSRTHMEFVPNTGYINLNQDQKVHHSKNMTGTRLSACWQYIRKV